MPLLVLFTDNEMRRLIGKRFGLWLILLVYSFSLLFLFFPARSEDSPRNRFGKGKNYVSLISGYGDGFSIGFVGDQDGRKVELLAIFPSIGFGLSDMKAVNKWYRGNFDLLVEGQFITNFEPERGASVGANFMMRYNFLARERLIPYAGLGAGIGYLDFNLESQEDGLIFYPQTGLGLHYFLTNQVAVDASWRVHHMSNSGTNMPNRSINTNLFLLGVSVFLD
ncbi:MAG TPA: acyloxyacyl hydrolase [Thermodesulfobacteriota bacterium]|nr:acyloxyacyl hydrolase [Thermodesulfobacteriota bacterium]